MNHGKISIYATILPLTAVIGSLLLARGISSARGIILSTSKLPLTLVSGSIFGIYTSLLWFIYYLRVAAAQLYSLSPLSSVGLSVELCKCYVYYSEPQLAHTQ